MALTIDDSIAQLERILEKAFGLGLKTRKLTVPDVPGLRLVPSNGPGGGPSWKTDDLVYVTSVQNVFVWAQASTLADDGVNVVKPADAGATGRWLLGVSGVEIDGVNIATIASGLVKNVVLHNGDFSEEALKAHIYGKAPCIAIHFAGGKHKSISQIPGALYDYRVDFDIWSVSRNFRDRFEAALGSDVPSEIDDPGVMKIHGMAKKLLAGRGGDEYVEPSIKWTEIGDEQLIHSDLAERVFVMSLSTTVLASIHNPDAPAQLVMPTEVDVHRQRSNAPGAGQFDLNNLVTLGLDVPLGTGFTMTIAAGTALIAGATVTAVATAHTFPASRDIYRDLTPAGAWVFASVALGADPPALAAGNLRVGRTTTDATGVVADSFLCSVQIEYPAPNTPDIDPI